MSQEIKSKGPQEKKPREGTTNLTKRPGLKRGKTPKDIKFNSKSPQGKLKKQGRHNKPNKEIDPTCRLCLQANETLHHLMTDCEATTSLQMDIMKNQIPLPEMTWSIKRARCVTVPPI